MFTGPADPYFVDTVRNVTGINRIADASGGNVDGVVYVPIVRAVSRVFDCEVESDLSVELEQVQQR